MACSGHIWEVLAYLASTNGQRVEISEVQMYTLAEGGRLCSAVSLSFVSVLI